MEASGKPPTNEDLAEIEEVKRLHLGCVETQARVYITASDGKSYTPGDGFHRMVVVTNDHYFHAPGSFTIDLPAGPATIEVAKGFEYQPEKKQVTVAAGQTRSVDVALKDYLDVGGQWEPRPA